VKSMHHVCRVLHLEHCHNHLCSIVLVCAELQEMHQTAQSDAKESREELDSLSNLIGRLDFNDFFKPKPDYRAMLAQGAI